MPSGRPSRSQPTLATPPQRRRSPLRALLRLLVLLVFLVAAAYLAHAIWNAVQYLQTPLGYANFGLVPSMVALPGLGLSVDTELVIGLAMLVLFIGSSTLLLATRQRHATVTAPSPAGAAGVAHPDAPSVAPSAPGPLAGSPVATGTPVGEIPAPSEQHGLPLLPHMLIPTLPPEEAALLVPPADTPPPEAPDSNAPEGSSDGSP